MAWVGGGGVDSQPSQELSWYNLNLKLPPHVNEGRKRLKNEAGKSILIHDNFNISKGNLDTRLALGISKTNGSLEILKVDKEASVGLSHMCHAGVFKIKPPPQGDIVGAVSGSGKASGTHVSSTGKQVRSLDPAHCRSVGQVFYPHVPQ